MPAGPFAPGLGGGGEWRSDSLASLVADFDSRFGITPSGSNVGQWDAHLGLAYSFAPPGSLKPAREGTGWTAAGSGLVYPSILFDGSSDLLHSTNTVGGIALANRLIGGTRQPGTIILVSQLVTFASDVSILSFTKVGLSPPDRRFTFAARTTGNLWRTGKEDDAGSEIFRDSAAAPDTSRHVLVLRHSGTAARLRVDGTEVINASQNVGLMTVDRVELGSTYGSNLGNIRVVRVILCSAELSNAETDVAVAGLTDIYL